MTCGHPVAVRQRSSNWTCGEVRSTFIKVHGSIHEHPWTYMNIHQDSVALRAMCSFERLYNGFIRWFQFNSALPALVQRLWKAIQSFPLVRLHCSLMVISFYSPLAAGCTMLYSKGPFSSLAPSKSLPIVQLLPKLLAYIAVYLYFFWCWMLDSWHVLEIQEVRHLTTCKTTFGCLRPSVSLVSGWFLLYAWRPTSPDLWASVGHPSVATGEDEWWKLFGTT